MSEANCLQSLGDIALLRSDVVTGRARLEEALGLYTRISEPYSMGSAHRGLALISSEAERRQHVDAARAAWSSIDRSDLVRQLDAEFPAS
jgi:hypothetical protein